MHAGSIATAAMEQAHPENTSYGQVIEYIQGTLVMRHFEQCVY